MEIKCFGDILKKRENEIGKLLDTVLRFFSFAFPSSSTNQEEYLFYVVPCTFLVSRKKMLSYVGTRARIRELISRKFPNIFRNENLGNFLEVPEIVVGKISKNLKKFWK